MKNYIIIVLLVFTSCVSKQSCDMATDDARFNEKIRWVHYINDSVSPQVIRIEVDYAIGKIDAQEAFHRLILMQGEYTKPFYK